MNRRELFRNIAGLGLIGATRVGSSQAAEEGSDATLDSAPDCVLTPRQTEGPFYFDAGQVRKDITEGRPGIPLRLVVGVVTASSCEPLPDAVVDVWHCDAGGVYSGFVNRSAGERVDAREDDFMRGIQVTNEDGVVELETIYPGWYQGRLTHIHFKVHLDERTMVTSQWYFPDAITREVYAQEPYNARGQNTTTPSRDGVLRADQLDALTMKIRENKDGPGYVGYHTVAIT
jgi:protocatechuate 3,4-dioxygenase beta subunit